MNRRFRLGVLNSHPIQYFAPLYAYLNQDKDLEVSVLYCSDFSLRGATDPGFRQAVTWDVELLAGYRSVFLGANARRRTPTRFWSLICPEVWSEIRHGQYDAIVLHGYGYAVNIVALLAAKTKDVPVFMRSETHLGLRRSARKQRLRDIVLSLAYRFLDGFLAIGTANRAYYRALGVPDRKIFDVPYCVDNERFIAGTIVTPEQRDGTRRRYGLPTDGLVILYSSKFTLRKHPDDLIRAVAALGDHQHSPTLFMVGTGEMESELRDLAGELARGKVVFGGFVNQSELPAIYAASDVFVLPSENEPWGLVVNEAMCAGIPVIVSGEAGCVADLVNDGVNGYHTKSGDVSSLVAALELVIADQQLRVRMGLASRSIIGNWGYAQCRQGIKAALASVMTHR